MPVCRLLAHDCHCHFNLILLGFACRSFYRFFFSFCFEPRQSMRYHHRHRQQHTIHRILSYSYFTVHMATTVIERSMHQEHPVRAQPSNRVNANINTYIMKWQELVFFSLWDRKAMYTTEQRTNTQGDTHTHRAPEYTHNSAVPATACTRTENFCELEIFCGSFEYKNEMKQQLCSLRSWYAFFFSIHFIRENIVFVHMPSSYTYSHSQRYKLNK